MDAEALVRPVVEAAGLELVEVTFRREAGPKVLRVVVDREGGVDLDTIARPLPSRCRGGWTSRGSLRARTRWRCPRRGSSGR